jgi:hypothetical protein
MNRLGDNGQVVLLQLVQDEGEAGKSKKTVNKRTRRAAAYKEMVKAIAQGGVIKEEKEEPVAEAAEEGEAVGKESAQVEEVAAEQEETPEEKPEQEENKE